ncbi:unnamed protein product [Orchesella dallaii]|uniref:Uncharacterized protein n=1 Tax=Orchesella dallaii TaxID=48710 RepID=A0ABP1QUI9_9HEXA
MASQHKLVDYALLGKERESEQEKSEDTEENWRLQKRLAEMKHRLCLFEYGIGSIATLLQNSQDVRKPPTSFNNGLNSNKTSLVEGIIKILGDVEKSLSAAETENGEESRQEKCRPIQLPAATGVPCLVAVNPTYGANKVSPKARIFIDETETGGNSLTSICNIETVDNSAIFTSGGKTTARWTTSHSHYSDPALAALSTLAAVATTQVEVRSAQNEVGNGAKFLSFAKSSHPPTPDVGEGSSKKCVNYAATSNVPFKKRKMMDRNVKSFRFKRPRDVV